jgi:hypothetical protein
MGRKPLKLNEKFFDIESRATHYVHGAFCAIYKKQGRKFTIKSRHRELIEIIKDRMRMRHTIVSDPRGRSSHWITTAVRPYLDQCLEHMGLNRPIEQREFPAGIDEYYLSHFVRGFFDAKADVSTNKEHYTHVNFSFPNRFLKGLHEALIEYADVSRASPRADHLGYSHFDSLKLHDFIYNGWHYIEKTGLYVPSKRHAFNIEYRGTQDKEYAHTKKVRERIERAKELIRQGASIAEIIEETDYSGPTVLYRAFKNVTGRTMREWRKANC